MVPLNQINRMRQAGSTGVAVFILRHGPRYVLVYSAEHGAWWRPGNCGYTLLRDEAGVYTFLQALRLTQHCGPEKDIRYDFVQPAELE